MEKRNFVDRKLMISNEDGGKTRLRRAIYYASKTDKSEVLLFAKPSEEFLKLRSIPEHNILQPLTIVKATGKQGVGRYSDVKGKASLTNSDIMNEENRTNDADLAMEDASQCMEDLVWEKNVLFSDEQGNVTMTLIFRRALFDVGTTLSSLHRLGFYHGDLNERNTFFDAENKVQLSGLLGSSIGATILGFEGAKEADWSHLATLIERIFTKRMLDVPLVLDDLLSSLKVPRVSGDLLGKQKLFFGHPFWWSVGHKKTTILDADLNWDLVYLDANILSWPSGLEDYRKKLNSNSFESRFNYNPKISSFIRWLANKVLHPEFHGLLPFRGVEGNADVLIGRLDDIWPTIWIDLLKHKNTYHR